METGILEWYDEQVRADYPLAKPCGYPRLMVDASFMQFDGFVPTLVKADVQETKIVFYLLTDAGELAYEILAAKFNDQKVNVALKAPNGRYLGCITHSDGLDQLYKAGIGMIEFNIPFAANTVASINSNTGVYSIDGYVGGLTFVTFEPSQDQLTSLLDRTIYIDAGSSNNWIWNAAAVIKEKPSINVLKTLNGVPATNFNVNIVPNDVISIERQDASLTFSVVTPLEDKISPILKYQA